MGREHVRQRHTPASNNHLAPSSSHTCHRNPHAALGLPARLSTSTPSMPGSYTHRAAVEAGIEQRRKYGAARVHGDLLPCGARTEPQADGRPQLPYIVNRQVQARHLERVGAGAAPANLYGNGTRRMYGSLHASCTAALALYTG